MVRRVGSGGLATPVTRREQLSAQLATVRLTLPWTPRAARCRQGRPTRYRHACAHPPTPCAPPPAGHRLASRRLLVIPGNDSPSAEYLSVFLDSPEASLIPTHLSPRAKFALSLESSLGPEAAHTKGARAGHAGSRVLSQATERHTGPTRLAEQQATGRPGHNSAGVAAGSLVLRGLADGSLRLCEPGQALIWRRHAAPSGEGPSAQLFAPPRHSSPAPPSPQTRSTCSRWGSRTGGSTSS